MFSNKLYLRFDLIHKMEKKIILIILVQNNKNVVVMILLSEFIYLYLNYKDENILEIK